MATQLDRDQEHEFDSEAFQQSLFPYYREFLREFKKTTRSHALFHIGFASLFLAEFFCLFSFFSFLTQPTIMAFSIGIFFLSCLSYCILYFYLQTKKPEQLENLLESFLNSCKNLITIPSSDPEFHLSNAHALLRLASYLQDFEKHYYLPSKGFKSMRTVFLKLGIYFHSLDIFKMRHLLIVSAIEEHMHQIRHTPTDFELHTSLASSYVTLSKLYLQQKKRIENQKARSKAKRWKELLNQQFRKAANQALEEFNILCSFSPDDPWIHAQLAQTYQDLQMPEEEIEQYETLRRLRPNDLEILLRLGILYFQQGQNAQGLKIYEELKEENFQKAEDLMAYYGSYQVQSSFEEML